MWIPRIQVLNLRHIIYRRFYSIDQEERYLFFTELHLSISLH